MILSTDGSLVWADAEKAAVLSQAAVNPSAAGKLYQATCDLIVAPITPNGSTQFGDLTLPAWAAYAAQVITWTAGQVTTRGLAEMDGDSVAFTLPSGAVGQTIYGWAVSSTTPILAATFILDTPVFVADAGTCIVTPVLLWQS